MIKITEKDISKILNSLVGRRFETIDEICNAIAVNNGFWKVNLVKDEVDIVVGDYILIGQVGVVDTENREYDIEVYYIKDNQDNFYITETQVLWEL